MKVMIAGYGRMGQLIEKTLLEEEGAAHEVVCRIDLEADPALIGTRQQAKITDASTWALFGTL